MLALGRIVLQQADQLHRLELDTGFFLVLATAPAAGTVIPTMFRSGGTLEEEAHGNSGSGHMFVGGHDDAMHATGAQQIVSATL